jgi:hypothetical protein
MTLPRFGRWRRCRMHRCTVRCGIVVRPSPILLFSHQLMHRPPWFLPFSSCTGTSKLPSPSSISLSTRSPARPPRAPPIHLHAREPRDVAVRRAGCRTGRSAPPSLHGREVRRARTAVHARIGARGHRVRARGARHGLCVWRRGGGRRAGALTGAATAVGERADVPRASVRCGGIAQARSIRGELSAPERTSAYTDRAISAPHTSTHVLHSSNWKLHTFGVRIKQLCARTAIRRLFTRFPR